MPDVDKAIMQSAVSADGGWVNVQDDVAYVLCRMLDEEWSYMSASIVDLSCGSTFGH